jgi:hypothetical protein
VVGAVCRRLPSVGLEPLLSVGLDLVAVVLILLPSFGRSCNDCCDGLGVVAIGVY